jgi:hypothetical protein
MRCLACNSALVATMVFVLPCCNRGPATMPDDGRVNAPLNKKVVQPIQKTPAEIEAIWIRRINAIDESNSKARFGSESVEFQSVLSEDCSQSDRDELLNYAASAPGGSNKAGFPRIVVAGLIAFYAERGDRANLVAVLAEASPQKVGLRDVEDYIVLSSRGISEPVSILFDAFALSQSPSARAAISDSMRRGFAFVGTLPDDDVELVAWCKKWYEENRTMYIENSDYSQNSSMGSSPGRYRSNGLFVPKSQ